MYGPVYIFCVCVCVHWCVLRLVCSPSALIHRVKCASFWANNGAGGPRSWFQSEWRGEAGGNMILSSDGAVKIILLSLCSWNFLKVFFGGWKDKDANGYGSSKEWDNNDKKQIQQCQKE